MKEIHDRLGVICFQLLAIQLLLLLVIFSNLASADIHAAAIFATPLDEGVGGSGGRIEWTGEKYYVNADIVNMRYKNQYIIGPQVFVSGGREFKWNLWGVEPILRIGVGATSRRTQSVSGHFYINSAAGFRYKKLTVLWNHGSTAGATHDNRGYDYLVFGLKI